MHHHPMLQPSPHDELVEPPDPPAPSLAAVQQQISALRGGLADAAAVVEWAEAVLAQHLFPTADEDDAQARLGEAVMQLSMLDRVPLADHQLATLQGFLAGAHGWSAWMAALR